MLIVVADKADRTREQDTVGDLSREQVGAALNRQLQRSQKTSQSAAGPLTDLAGDVDSFKVKEAIEAVEVGSDASEEQQQESLRALRELKQRVPLMAQTNIDSAMKRLLGGGKQTSDDTIKSKGSADAKDKSQGVSKASSNKSESGNKASSDKSKVGKLRKPRKPKSAPVAEAPAAEAPAAATTPKDAPKAKARGKHSPDHQYEDGTVLYSAESLSKINFD